MNEPRKIIKRRGACSFYSGSERARLGTVRHFGADRVERFRQLGGNLELGRPEQDRDRDQSPGSLGRRATDQTGGAQTSQRYSPVDEGGDRRVSQWQRRQCSK